MSARNGGPSLTQVRLKLMELDHELNALVDAMAPMVGPEEEPGIDPIGTDPIRTAQFWLEGAANRTAWALDALDKG